MEGKTLFLKWNTGPSGHGMPPSLGQAAALKLAGAEERLNEIETQVEAAEKRVKAAERRADLAEETVADELARAREAAAGWLQGQLDTLRREAEGR